MHTNSLTAYRMLDRQRRMDAIMAAFQQHGPMTDRQCRHAIGMSEMNDVRPRITELVDSESLVEIGKVRDAETGRPVRVCRIKPQQQELAI